MLVKFYFVKTKNILLHRFTKFLFLFLVAKFPEVSANKIILAEDFKMLILLLTTFFPVIRRDAGFHSCINSLSAMTTRMYVKGKVFVIR